MEEYHSNDISVVLQGPIFGANANSEDDEWTRLSCESIRKYLPGAEIIVSTWAGEDVSGLDYDKVVFNKKIDAPYVHMPFTHEVKMYSVNHQIITSIAGILEATRPLVLKMRTDMVLLGTGVLDYYNNFKDLGFDPEWHFFSSRVVVLPTYNPKYDIKIPFNICDWIYFGKKSDIHSIFDIPLMKFSELKYRECEEYAYLEENYGSEQYIWLQFVNKYKTIKVKNTLDISDELIIMSERCIANNLIMSSAQKLDVLNLKMPFSGYGAKPMYSQGLYTEAEWKKMVKKYADESIVEQKNLSYDLGYSIMYYGRKYCKKYFHLIYNIILKIVRYHRKINSIFIK